jgi:hypothetical protein
MRTTPSRPQLDGDDQDGPAFHCMSLNVPFLRRRAEVTPY